MTDQVMYRFPKGFLWGCATAAHQVEGQSVNDWADWEKTPGRVFQNQQSGNACEWWAGRYAEDFDRAAEMHNNAQRISIEWSRIEPEPGRWDDSALDRYREMVKALRARGMTPMVTLHHFSNPRWVGEHNGWLWDETPRYFERYVRKVIPALSDLCSLWCTVNEPMIYIIQGFSLGVWPPGLKDSKAAGHAALNLLKGHAAAYHAIKALQPEAQVGFASHFSGVRPMTPRLLNVVPSYFTNFIVNLALARATIHGKLWLPFVKPVTIPNVKGTLDWIGVQYYQQMRVGFDLKSPQTAFIAQYKPDDLRVGPGTWGGIAPEFTFDAIQALWKTTHKPVYITECGTPDPTDEHRPGYLVKAIYSTFAAIAAGIPVRGLFVWSLLDNFEWAEGFDPRFNFGLYQTNFATQERTPRPSAKLYGDICAQNGLTPEMIARYAPDLVS